MAKITDVDIRLMLGRLRPKSEYRWGGGGGDTGNTMEAVAEWRDRETEPPTETEVLREWDVYQQEQIVVETQRQAAKADLDGVKPGIVQAALDGIETDLAGLVAANLTETKQIIGRMLVRQRVIIRAIRHLAT